MTRTKSWEKVLNDTQWFSFVVSGDRFRRFLEEDTKNFETLLRDLGVVK